MQDDEFLRSELHQIQHRDRSSHVSGAVADVPRTPAGNGEHDSRAGYGGGMRRVLGRCCGREQDAEEDGQTHRDLQSVVTAV